MFNIHDHEYCTWVTYHECQCLSALALITQLACSHDLYWFVPLADPKTHSSFKKPTCLINDVPNSRSLRQIDESCLCLTVGTDGAHDYLGISYLRASRSFISTPVHRRGKPGGTSDYGTPNIECSRAPILAKTKLALSGSRAGRRRTQGVIIEEKPARCAVAAAAKADPRITIPDPKGRDAIIGSM